MFKRCYQKTASSNKTTRAIKGYHPEILFLINRPYAEYVDYKEVK